MLKSAGGMTHGREITDSTLTNWVHSFPLTIPICKSLEQFINVNCTSSYQHRDLNAGSDSKDKRDHEAFYMWLSAHSPFDYTCESVVCLSTGMIAAAPVPAPVPPAAAPVPAPPAAAAAARGTAHTKTTRQLRLRPQWVTIRYMQAGNYRGEGVRPHFTVPTHH